MADDIAERVIAMKRGQISIKELLARKDDDLAEIKPAGDPPPQLGEESSAEPAAGKLPSLDNLALLPGPGEPYKAFARPANQMLPTLFLLLDDASAKGYSYANLDTINREHAGTAGQGPVLVLRYYGVIPSEVRLEGRNLDSLYNYIGQHRVMWVRQLHPERDFLDPKAKEPVITGITISKVVG